MRTLRSAEKRFCSWLRNASTAESSSTSLRIQTKPSLGGNGCHLRAGNTRINTANISRRLPRLISPGRQLLKSIRYRNFSWKFPSACAVKRQNAIVG